jgi:hypothetical protein
MNTEHARKINNAACACWFFQQGITDKLPLEHVATIQGATVGQIQTASEVIEAENAEAPAINGKTHLSFVLDPSGAKRVHDWAMKQKTAA